MHSSFIRLPFKMKKVEYKNIARNILKKMFNNEIKAGTKKIRNLYYERNVSHIVQPGK